MAIVISLISSGSIVAWTMAAVRWQRQQSLLEFQSRLPVPWGLLDLAAVVVLNIFVTGTMLAVGTSILGISRDRASSDILPPALQSKVILLYSTGTLLSLWLGVIWVRKRVSASGADLGIQPNRVLTDIALGITAFVMLAFPVFTLQVTINVLTQRENTHPLIELLRNDPDPRFFLIAGFAAVVAAPLTEEYLFRVLLQGWIENAIGARRARRPEGKISGWVMSLVSGQRASNDPGHFPTADRPRCETGASDLGQVMAATDRVDLEHPQPLPIALAPAYVPIVVSSLLFAAAHLGQGTAPIPLFFLALGLGYVYQRTHRVLPCIVVHMLVNLFSLLQLWVIVHS
ncbi:MAG: CPBP family intramembrane glutamic endopeptidase [Pirellulaceae bacterium]